MTDKTILDVENLKVIFPGAKGVVRAVEGDSLQVREGECVALVGERLKEESAKKAAAEKASPPWPL